MSAPTIPDDVIRDLIALRVCPPEKEPLRSRYLHYAEEVEEHIEALFSFSKTMEEGGAIAFGRFLIGEQLSIIASGGEAAKGEEVAQTPLAEVSSDIWRRASIFDFKRSALIGPFGTISAIVDIRIYPPTIAPNLKSRMAGKSLREAFSRLVQRDALLIRALEDASHDSAEPANVLTGEFSANNRLWPLNLLQPDLETAWLNKRAWAISNGYGAYSDWEVNESLKSEFPASVRDAARQLRERVTCFLRPLRDGTVVATGHPRYGGPVAGLSSEIWNRSNTVVDYVSGDVFALRSTHDGSKALELEWSAITLSWGEHPVPVDAKINNEGPELIRSSPVNAPKARVSGEEIQRSDGTCILIYRLRVDDLIFEFKGYQAEFIRLLIEDHRSGGMGITVRQALK